MLERSGPDFHSRLVQRPPRPTAKISVLPRDFRPRQFEHPDRGHPIWAPFGLGLQVERVNGGIRWRDADRRVSLVYTYKPNTTVDSAFRSALSAFIWSGAAIAFKVARRDFYAISAEGSDRIDSYTRYHQAARVFLVFY